METKKRYRYQQQTVTQNFAYTPENVADIEFINQGTSRVQIDSIILLPGDTLLDSALGDEYNTTQYNISFLDALTNNLIIKKKIYLK